MLTSSTPPAPTRPEVVQLLEFTLASKVGDYVYVFVPKAACTSAKAALWRAEAARSPAVGPLADPKRVHARSHDADSPWTTAGRLADLPPYLLRMLPARPALLTLVRNPISRIYSAYENKIAGPSDIDPETELARMGWTRRKRPSFEAFVKLVADQPPESLNEHWRPQTLVTQIDHVGYDRILAFEVLGRDLPALVRAACGKEALVERFDLNATGSEARKLTAYTDRALDVVHKVYADDFARFGYDLDPIVIKPDRAVLRAAAKEKGFSPALTETLRAMTEEASA